MNILRKIYRKFDEGAYSVVFFDEHGYAIKVFRKRKDATREHVQNVFESEVEAYQIATTNNELKAFVPEFFGIVSYDGVLDEIGDNISDEFYLDLSYKMGKVEGLFEKTGLRDNNLQKAFHDAGIHHTKDASVLYQGGEVKCILDFAVQEFELYHQ